MIDKTELYDKLNSAARARAQMYLEKFTELDDILGEEASRALLSLYGIYDERFYVWLTNLYDPEIGGFYYSESARDAEGFGPDIESTMQILRFTQRMGLTYGKPLKEAYSEKVKAALIKFTQGLQDPENGFFYHPQWGRNINIPRRSRDLSWSVELLSSFGVKPLYPTPMDKLKGDDNKDPFQEHLGSLDSFKKYLSQFNLMKNPYWIGNTLQSQAIQIKAAGNQIVDHLCNWLEENQREDNGLWQEKVTYDSVNALTKFALTYITLDRPIPNPEKAFESAVQVALSNNKIICCSQVCNPLSAISAIIANVAKFQGKDKAESLRQTIICKAIPLIATTRKKILLCRDPNGLFHYNTYGKVDGRRSQMAPVSLCGINEPGVNGAIICINATIGALCDALGIQCIPIFGNTDADIFHELINSAKQYPKIYDKPEWFDSYLVPEGSSWN